MRQNEARVWITAGYIILALSGIFQPTIQDVDALIYSPSTNRFQRSFSLCDSSISDHESSNLDETKLLIEAQQRQIDNLIEILSAKSTTADDPRPRFTSTTTNIALSPLKVMIFIDGTWLYYSLHTRDDAVCPIQQRFGTGWQHRYNMDWGKLPRIIGHALQQQDIDRGWMPLSPSGGTDSPARPVEVVRVSVYTSFRPDTPKTSLRYQMFQDMIRAKYDVMMLETIGPNEKCVDIQLAVDMLHYATVPDAYDVALLLSGDRDFVPAMIRCRQKGRRVGLVSVRGYCNRAFYETPNIKDYDVIWLDDYLDDIVKPLANAPHLRGNRPVPVLSEYTIMKVISDFVAASGKSSISSRDVGRYIKSMQIGDRCMLDEVKEIYGGLYQFLIVSGIFIVDLSASSKDFWVGLDKGLPNLLKEAQDKAALSEQEVDFFKTYSIKRLQNKMKYYEFTFRSSESEKPEAELEARNEPELSELTVSQLKDICREKGLKVSGKKSDLLERIRTTDETIQTSSTSNEDDQVASLDYLEGLLLEYLQASGGKASSRDVGRYLTANKASPSMARVLNVTSALSELKHFFGSLRQFVAQSEKFSHEEMDSGTHYEFLISVLSPR